LTTPTSSVQTPITQNNKPSLNQRLYPTFTDDEREARWKAVTNHAVIDPNKFTDPTDRFAAILARADRITSDPKFKSLPGERQQAVLANYYDRYVKPGYEGLGFVAPDKDLFLREMPKETGKLNSRSFYFGGYSNSETEQRENAAMGAQAGKVVKGISYAGIWIGKQLAYQQLGLSHFLHLDNADLTTEQNTIEQTADKAKATVDKVSNGIFDSDKFWLQTHPSKRFTSELANNIGEQLINLPLYTEIGAMRIGATSKIGEVIPKLGRAANLTERLGLSKSGQFIARRLAEGSDAFIGGTLLGETTREKLTDMAIFMGFGTGVEGITKGIQLPTKLLVKILSGRNSAIGGKILQEGITDAADHELSNNIVGYNHIGEPVSIHPKTEDTGEIKVGSKIVFYNSKGEQQEAIVKAIQAHHQHDPVAASIVNAEKITLSAMGRQKYGKAWNQLSQAQRRVIRSARAELTEQATNEAALHNPEIVKAKIENEFQQELKTNPELGQFVAEIEQKSGLKVTDELRASEAEQLESETGIKQTQGTIEKIGKLKSKAQQVEGKVKSKIKNSVKDLLDDTEPKSFAQMRTNNIAYFTNRAKAAGSTSNLTKELKDTDSDEFIHSILEEMGHTNYKFENAEHALLWANSFREELPKPFQRRLIEELHEIRPRETIKIWDEKSKNLAIHMKQLAFTKRLFTEGNVFRSTSVDKWLSKTKWQHELLKEVEDTEMVNLKKVMKRYPKQFKIAQDTLKFLQAARQQAASPEDYEKLNDTIHDVIKEHTKHTIKTSIAEPLLGNQNSES